LCRAQFDVVVMNPPFGAPSVGAKDSITDAYANSKNDLLGVFVDRGLQLLRPRGRLGAITSRTCFFLTSFTDWRENVVLGRSALEVVADLGQGVMDDAMVEAAAYVLERGSSRPETLVIRAIADEDRKAAVEASATATRQGLRDRHLFLGQRDTFDLLPGSPFVYWVGSETIRKFETGLTFEPETGSVRQGLSTSDNFRFVRAVWEVAYEDTFFCYYPPDGSDSCSFDDPVVKSYISRRNAGRPVWAFLVMAGPSQPWFAPVTVKVNFHRWGHELANFKDSNGKPKGVLRNTAYYFRPRFSWTRRAVRFIPYVIPGNCIPSASRYMAFPEPGKEAESLGVCASRLGSSFLRFFAEFWQRPNFLVENVKALPWPNLGNEARQFFKA
jgi:hypothetical protein